MNKILGIAPLAALLLTTPVAAGGPAPLALDQNQVHIGSGVICDTRDEVQRFVSLMANNDAGGALHIVNREKENPLACGMATVAFRAGKEHAEISNGKGSYKIVEIEVLAGTANGKWHAITPRRTQYTAIPIPGIDI